MSTTQKKSGPRKTGAVAARAMGMNEAIHKLHDLPRKLREPVYTLDRKIEALEAELEGMKRRREFEATRLARTVQALLNADLSAFAAMQPYDESLRKLLEKVGGWGTLRESGASDAQIREKLSSAWSTFGSASAGQSTGRGGEKIAVWIDAQSYGQKPTLEGAKLVAEARRVLGIPAAGKTGEKGMGRAGDAGTKKKAPTPKAVKPKPRTPAKKTPAVQPQAASAAPAVGGAFDWTTVEKSPKQKQTFGQWLSSLDASLAKSGGSADRNDARLAVWYQEGKSAAEVGRQLRATAQSDAGGTAGNTKDADRGDDRPRGEPVEELGAVNSSFEDAEAASILESVPFNAREQKTKNIPKVWPLRLNGKQYVAIGFAHYPSPGNERAADLRPLYGPNEFLLKHGGTDHSAEGYTGARVKVGAKEFVIGPKGEGRTLLWGAGKKSEGATRGQGDTGKTAQGAAAPGGEPNAFAEALLAGVPESVREYLRSHKNGERRLYALKLWKFRTAASPDGMENPDREYAGMANRESIASILEMHAGDEGIPWRTDGARFEVEAGNTYAAADMAVTPGQLEASLDGARIFPPAPEFDETGCGRIGTPIEIGGDFYAVVGAAHASGRVTYELLPITPDETYEGTPVNWRTRRDDNPNVAPEEIPRGGVRVVDPAGADWVLGDDEDAFQIEVEEKGKAGGGTKKDEAVASPRAKAVSGIPGILKVGDSVQLGIGGGVFAVTAIGTLPEGQFELIVSRPAVGEEPPTSFPVTVRVVGNGLEDARLFYRIAINPQLQSPASVDGKRKPAGKGAAHATA